MHKHLKPYKNFSVANVTQGYHQFHRAIDSLPFRKEGFGGYGTPLVAPDKVTIGKVYTPQFFKDNPHDDAPVKNGYGMWMKDSQGYEILYWHCQPVFPVQTGDVVEKGTIIAYCGNSGNVYSNGEYVPIEDRNKPNFAGTHLHHQVVKNGELLNPMDFIDLVVEPNYSVFDELKSYTVVLGKILKLVA